MTIRLFSAAVLLGVLLTGCGARDTQAAKPSAPTPASGEGVVSGTVAYRERSALPPDATVEVWLRDVTPNVMLPMAILAEATIEAKGRQVPIPFELRYDPAKIDASHVYAVKAVIRRAGAPLFESPEDTRVITQGHAATGVSLLLRRTEQDTLGPGTPPAVGGAGAGAVVTDGQPAASANGLVGTAWTLTDLGGAGVVEKAEATLEFTEPGRVAGRGSCNRFFGTVEIAGESITFGPIGSTRMACLSAGVAEQETKYFAALEGAERFTRKGDELLLYTKSEQKPLRFVRKELTPRK